MKKLKILVIIFLLSLSICAFVSIQAVKAAPAITLSINTGHIGDTVTVSGTGFPILSTITIRFDTASVLTVPTPIIAGFDGSFNAYFTIPTSTVGAHTISASDGTNSANAQFTLTSNLAAPTISASPGTVDQGQTSALSSTPVTTGNSPYTYQWLAKAPGSIGFSTISGATSSGYTFVTTGSTATGSWSFELQVRDAATALVTSNAVSVTVNAPPTVSIAPIGPFLMDTGQTQVFTATSNGGSGTRSYQWYLGSSPVSGANSLTYSYTASGSSASITCKVTDSAPTPVTSTSNAVTITVAASPTVSIAPAGSFTMDVGQSKVFTATPTGGSGTIHYQWYVGSGTVGADSSSYTYTASGSSASITCKVTDSASSPVTSAASNAVSVTVNPALVAPTVSATSNSINQGQTSTLSSSSVTTGTSPYTYQWLQKAPGVSSYTSISGATSSGYSFETTGSTTPGSWSFELQVTDANSALVTSSPVVVTVNSVPTVDLSPTSLSMDVGQSQLFTAAPRGGSGSYISYRWYVGGTAQIGQTLSTFSYLPTSAGSFSITATVTDSLSSTSPQSSAASVTVSASPTVRITPAGSFTMDVGQSKVFTATPTGGSGTIHYLWYVGSGTVGADSSSYTYTASGSSASITCKVTDSASSPVTSAASNAVSVTVNPALVAPTVSATSNSINQGQTSTLSSSSVTTGTSPYTYQWLQKSPGASSFSSISGATSSSYSFATTGTTVNGSWSFELQVRDAATALVTSNAVSVIVNLNPLDHFIFSSIGAPTAGTPFSITITAKNTLGNTITNYVGTNALNVSTGTITPVITGTFTNGVWTGSVTITGAGSGVWLSTSGSGMTGTSGTFTVNSGALDHFTFNAISAQTTASAFSISVTAQDVYNNTVSSYVGTPSLTCSAGSINPTTMTAFVAGVGSTSVTIASSGSSVTITATDGTHSGTSNSFAVNLTSTSTPTPSSQPSETPTTSPKPSTAPTATPSPTPIPNSITITTLTDRGKNASFTFQGDVTSSSISGISVTTDGSNTTTTVSLAVISQSRMNGFNNVTIPIAAIPYGMTPTIYVNNGLAPSQGYSQDANNYYLWYKTSYPTYGLSIAFETKAAPVVFSYWVIIAVILIVVVAVVAVYIQKILKTKNFKLPKINLPQSSD